MKRFLAAALFSLGVALAVDPVREAGIDQKLNAQIPLDTVFTDESGSKVRLEEYFRRGRPVVLALVYYECPMLCTVILNGLVSALKPISFRAGNEFDVLAISINPAESAALAARKKSFYLARYARAANPGGFHFLTGAEPSIRAVAGAVGFRYVYDEKSKQFAHASAIMLLTPHGRVSRYFYGVEYSPRDLRLGLIEAAQNRIGSPADQALLYCYRYDPSSGRYSLAVLNLVRLGAALTVLLLSAFLILMWRMETRRVWRKSCSQD